MKGFATPMKGGLNMAKVSLTQAAKDTGVSLPTLSRWRKSGKISAEKNGSGGYSIDTSEYDRIQEFRKSSPNVKGNMKGVAKESETPHETPSERGVLHVEVAVLRERIKDKDEMIQELREDRDDWKKQAQTLLLQAPAPTVPPVIEPSPAAQEKPEGSISQTETLPTAAAFPLLLVLSATMSFLVLVLGAIAFYHTQAPRQAATIPLQEVEPRPTVSHQAPKTDLPYTHIPPRGVSE